MTPPERLRLPSGQIASLARAADPADLAPALGAIGLSAPRPVLVLVGGADGLDAAVAEALGALLREAVAPLCGALGVLVIDGGTDSGVMALMGRARAAGGATFPLLGVAAVGTVRLPGETVAADVGRAPLEPNHSHFLLVPGRDWGDEVPWISDAAVLAGGSPAVTLVAGGGRLTELDVAASLAAGRPAVLLAGSGGTADRLIGRLAAGAPAPLLRPAPLSAGHRVGALLESLLTGRERPA